MSAILPAMGAGAVALHSSIRVPRRRGMTFRHPAAHNDGGLQATGEPIGALDTLIAGHALSLGLALVTHNTREFERVKGLELQNWHPRPEQQP